MSSVYHYEQPKCYDYSCTQIILGRRIDKIRKATRRKCLRSLENSNSYSFPWSPPVTILDCQIFLGFLFFCSWCGCGLFFKMGLNYSAMTVEQIFISSNTEYFFMFLSGPNFWIAFPDPCFLVKVDWKQSKEPQFILRLLLYFVNKAETVDCLPRLQRSISVISFQTSALKRRHLLVVLYQERVNLSGFKSRHPGGP